MYLNRTCVFWFPYWIGKLRGPHRCEWMTCTDSSTAIRRRHRSRERKQFSWQSSIESRTVNSTVWWLEKLTEILNTLYMEKRSVADQRYYASYWMLLYEYFLFSLPFSLLMLPCCSALVGDGMDMLKAGCKRTMITKELSQELLNNHIYPTEELFSNFSFNLVG
jgi:hypothetical protein